MVGLLALPSAASAESDGISHQACTGCHVTGASGGTSATVTFLSTPVVGQPVTIRVQVSHASSTFRAAGFNLRMSSGTFNDPPGPGAVRITSASEATHSTPNGSASPRTWNLTWTPSTSGSVGYSLYGNSVNLADGNANDAPMGSPTTGSVDVKRPQGAACTASSQCITNQCVDGVCCNSACSGSCQACTPAAGGQSAAGICSPLVADSPGCCAAGFRWTGSSCQEINECSGANDCCIAGQSNCDATATCGNTSGSYECDCATGFSGNGFRSSGGCHACPAGTTTFGTDQTCSNINECLTASCGPGTCEEIALGSWAAPGFVCNCNPGYEQVDLPGGRTCVDIDECARGTDDCTPEPAGRCTNTIGGFECSCETPAFVGATGRDCVDYDECTDATYTGLCSSVARCENGFGTWDCICNDGFEGDGFTCTDIEECARDLDDCHLDADCTNTVGAYTCTCHAGYEGTGVFCSDVDECASGTHGCGLNEVCVNQVGMPNLCECAVGTTRPTPDAPCEIRCGDGTRGRGERCDDANTAEGDGCSAICEIEAGWACDEPAGGPSVCEETCGDGLIDALEECDDGAANSDTAPDACRTTCLDAHCGDATVDSGEECDSGDLNDDSAPDGCRSTCDLAYCGDGVIDTGEVCDPGGGTPGASIAGACTTLCAPDAGIDPNDLPQLTGGACACRAGGAPSDTPSAAWLLLGAVVAIRRRLRRPR